VRGSGAGRRRRSDAEQAGDGGPADPGGREFRACMHDASVLWSDVT